MQAGTRSHQYIRMRPGSRIGPNFVASKIPITASWLTATSRIDNRDQPVIRQRWMIFKLVNVIAHIGQDKRVTCARRLLPGPITQSNTARQDGNVDLNAVPRTADKDRFQERPRGKEN